MQTTTNPVAAAESGAGPGRSGGRDLPELRLDAVGEAEFEAVNSMMFRLENGKWMAVSHADVKCGDELIGIAIRGRELEYLSRSKASTKYLPQADDRNALWLDSSVNILKLGEPEDSR